MYFLKNGIFPEHRHILKYIPPQLNKELIAAAASEPEANERGSSPISKRLHYRGLQSLFLTKREELWLCANGRFRMHCGMPQGIVVMRDREDFGCAVIWRKEPWIWANG